METAETLLPSQVNFIRRVDFLELLVKHAGASLRAAEQLGANYCAANERARALGLSSSASEKLAKLILEWCIRGGKESQAGVQLKLTLTHEEIAELIGSSRETVTRMFADFKAKRLIQLKGATLTVLNKPGLEAMVTF